MEFVVDIRSAADIAAGRGISRSAARVEFEEAVSATSLTEQEGVSEADLLQAAQDGPRTLMALWTSMPRSLSLESIEWDLTQIILSAREESQTYVEDIQTQLAWKIDESVKILDRSSVIDQFSSEGSHGDSELETFRDRILNVDKDDGTTEVAGCLRCNHCHVLIAGDCPHLHCQECGNFSICGRCYRSGEHCLETSHMLRPGLSISSTTPAFAFLPAPIEKYQSARAVPIVGIHTLNAQSQVLDVRLGPALDTYLSVMESSGHFSDAILEDLSRYDQIASAFPRSRVAFILSYWAKVCYLLANDDTFLSFRAALTPTQRSSIRILFEWWTASIQDSEIMAEEISLLILQGMHGSRIDAEHLARNIRSPASKNSLYHAKMLLLFITEFNSSRAVHRQTIAQIRSNAAVQACTQRIGYLYYHREPLPVWLEERPRETTEDISASVNVWLKKIDLHTQLWRTMAKVGLSGSSDEVVADLEAESRCLSETLIEPTFSLFVIDHVCFGQRLGPVRLTPMLAPMQWLSTRETYGEFPRFLWHRKKRRTIEISDPSACPPYVAISHTWGRWRKRGFSHKLHNVPWEVPEISEDGPFRTPDLPEILREVPGSTEYIWFDLVCIPQDEDDAYYGPLKAQEIRKQAGIFSNAVNAIAWFSTIPDWSDLTAVVMHVVQRAAEYPHANDSSRLMILQRIFHLGSVEACVPLSSTEAWRIARDHAGENFDLLRLVHEWFTSLWTLQEVFMRPDMWLCCRNWTPLALPWPGAAPSFNVSFDGLICLLHAYTEKQINEFKTKHSNSEDEEIRNLASLTQELAVKVPGGVEPYHGINRNFRDLSSVDEGIVHVSTMLAQTMFQAGMQHLLGGNPMLVLSIGNRRICRSGYGEAIMSVLGAVDWHKEHRNSKNIVSGRYPAEFIDEVRQKFGSANLFYSAKSDSDFGHVKVIEEWQAAGATQIDDLNIVGSLMPFGSRRNTPNPPEQMYNIQEVDQYLRLETLPSANTWRILGDGRVVIRTASVLFATLLPETFAGRRQVGSWINDQHHSARFMDAETTQNVPLLPPALYVDDFRAWLAQQSYVCYALNVGKSDLLPHPDRDGTWGWTVYGVILREVQSGYLVKTGEYRTYTHTPEEDSEVDIVVM